MRGFKRRMLSVSIAAALLLCGCSSSNGSGGGTAGAAASQNDPNINIIKEHSFFTDYPDITFDEVVKKYVDFPKWTSSEDNGIVTVSVNGSAKGFDNQFEVVMTIQNDPEDPENSYLIDITKYQLGTVLYNTPEKCWDCVRALYENYVGGYDPSQGLDSDTSNSDISSQIPVYYRHMAEEAGYEWVEPITIQGSFITGVIKNVSGETKSIASITFTLYDGSDYQVGTAVDMTSDLADGSSWKFSAGILEQDVSTYLLTSLY